MTENKRFLVTFTLRDPYLGYKEEKTSELGNWDCIDILEAVSETPLKFHNLDKQEISREDAERLVSTKAKN